MRNIKKLVAVFSLTLLAAACSDDDKKTDTPDAGPPDPVVQTLSSAIDITDNGSPVASSSGTLTRNEATVSFEGTFGELTEGEVYTIWWVFFNTSEGCVDNPNDEGKPRCGFADVADETTIANSGVAFGGALPLGAGGAGCIAPASGECSFDLEWDNSDLSTLIVGQTDVGLSNYSNAEIHVLIQAHGPALEGENLTTQFGNYFGGCGETKGLNPPEACFDYQGFLYPDPDAGSSSNGHGG